MVRIIGHRGARNLWAENSLTGFRRTRELEVDGVEFDVHRARDGGLVVIHDPTLERTTVGSGAVGDKSVTELRAIRLRDSDGEGVPDLDSVLELFAGTGLELHVELKTDHLGWAYEGLEPAVLEAVARHGLGDQAILTSFAPQILETVRRLSPTQRVLASLDRRSAEMLGGLAPALDRFAAIEGCLVAVEKGLLADSLDLCLAHLGGERLGAWVPNEAQDIAFWLAQPIRQITTDRPDIALQCRSALT